MTQAIHVPTYSGNPNGQKSDSQNNNSLTSNMKQNSPPLQAPPTSAHNTTAQLPKLHSTPYYKDPISYPRSQNNTTSTSNLPSTSLELQHKYLHHSISSSPSREDLNGTQLPNENEWQQIGRVKRKRLIKTHPSRQPTQTEISNRFDMLTDEVSYPEPSDHPKPPLSLSPHQSSYMGS